MPRTEWIDPYLEESDFIKSLQNTPARLRYTRFNGVGIQKINDQPVFFEAIGEWIFNLNYHKDERTLSAFSSLSMTTFKRV
jgi:hypothetical protein